MHNKIYNTPEVSPLVVYDQGKHKTLDEFITQEYPYDVEILNEKVERIYSKRNLPRAIVFTPFTNRTAITRKYALQLKELGTKFKNKILFYLQDADLRSTRKFRLEGDATYIIFDTDMEKSKYRYTDKVFNGSIDTKALIEFTQKFLGKTAPLYIRTAEINPDDLSEPVYPVVAKTYKEVILNPKKHVFFRFFDKMVQRFADQFQMRKEWWKVGKNYTNNTRDILIAEIEINDNDVLEYFTKEMDKGHYYFLFTKKHKKDPYIYSGKVNATDLIAFAEDIIKKEDSGMHTDL